MRSISQTFCHFDSFSRSGTLEVIMALKQARFAYFVGVFMLTGSLMVGASRASAQNFVKIPIKWCGIEGSPSMDDPTVVGETTTKDVLWRRHERISDAVLIPTCDATLRSGAIAPVPDFPIIADPLTTAGSQPGDISLGTQATPDFDEYVSAIQDCRAAWEAQGFAGDYGITAVHINRFVDNTGANYGVLGLGGFAQDQYSDPVLQSVANNVMVIDNAYTLPTSPLLNLSTPDANDTILGQEVLHAVSLFHGNGIDEDADGNLDEDEVDGVDNDGDGLTDEDGPHDPDNLMYPFYPNGTMLTAAQCTRLRDQTTLHVPGTEVDPVPEPFADTGRDSLRDVPAAESFIDIKLAGVALETAKALTYFFLSTAGTFPDSGKLALEFSFMLDADGNRETGGRPHDLRIPTRAVGIELVGVVSLTREAGGKLVVSRAFYKFEDGVFRRAIDRRIVGRVRKESVAMLTLARRHIYDIGQIIHLLIPDAIRGPVATTPNLFVLSLNEETGTIDQSPSIPLTFINPKFPSCSVQPEVVRPGEKGLLQVKGLPPNEEAHILLGPDLIAEGKTDNQGNLTISLVIPETRPGQRLVTVGAGPGAITADCIVTVARKKGY